VDDPQAPLSIPVDEVPVPLAVVDGLGTVVRSNAGLDRLLDWSGETAGRSLTGELHLSPEESAHLLSPSPDHPVRLVVGSRVGDLELSATPVPLPEGSGVAVAVRLTSVPDDRLDQLVMAAHDALGEGVIVGDGVQVLHVNDAACRLYGYTRQELMDMGSLFGRFRPDEQDRISASVAGRAERGEPTPERFETVIVRKGGDELAVEVSVKAVVSGGRVRTLSIVRDATDRRRAEAELTRLAFHDPLTGLPNRLLFLDRVERSMTRARRNGTRGALLFLDLDGFKAVNDSFGHATGDEVLVVVGQRIAGVVREQDSASRLGGDEFGLLVDTITDEAQAEALQDRVADVVAAPVEVGGRVLTVTASIGTQLFGAEEMTAGELLGQADQAMFDAKRRHPRPRPPGSADASD
jgi:diguanylate cyclase (GGDEF)-like protein/PAS domain S-box-containing protein